MNAAKILLSYYMSKALKRPVHWGMPLSMSIEPTTACNLRCPECPSGLRSFTRDTGSLQQDQYLNTLDQVASHLMYLILYFQGEPYIHPRFLDLVSEAHNRGVYTITSTNAHFLDEKNAEKTVRSGLDRLIISIDGSTQSSYESYRREGDLQKVISGAEKVVKWKRKLQSRTPHVVFQFLVVKPNEAEIPEVYKLAREIGVDEVKLKTAQLYDYKHGHPLMPTDSRYARYRQAPDGTYEVKGKLEDHCWKMWHSCVVTWDGKVVPCCFDKDAHHILGDLQEESFRQIWRSNNYDQFRGLILKGRKNIEICQNCTEGCTVWA